MTIHVDDISKLNVGDQFTLTPTRGAARNMAMSVDNIRDLALAGPVNTSAPLPIEGKQP